MNKNKAIRLLATSWLIAPTILSTQSAFAVEQATQTTESSVVAQKTTNSSTLMSSGLTDSSATTETTTTSSSTTETSTSDSSNTTSSTTDSSTIDSSEETEDTTEEVATRTLTIQPTLTGKIKLKAIHADTKEETELTVDSSGVVKGLKEGTKIAYEITPSKDEKLVSFEVNGAQEVNYQQRTFTVGVVDLALTAKFESTTESTNNGGTAGSNGGSTGSSTDSSTGGSTNQNNGSNASNGSNGNNGNTGNTSGNHNGAAGNQSSSSENNNSVVSANNNGGSASQSGNQRPSGSAIENPGANSSDFVVKTPIESLLPANTTAVQQAIVKEAYKYLGSPYVWGAKGPTTFDCSGLTYYVYMKATGHYIGGWTGEQQYAGTQISVNQAQPGDLVFWGPSSGVTHHVGIYLGNGLFIHAPQPGDKVRITSIADYTPDFAVRVNIAGLPIANGSLSNSTILDGLGDSFNFSKNQTTDQFLKKIADSAQEIGQKEGIYASVMMAQAILESGSGNSLLASEPNYNLFGIKGDYLGQSVSFNTLEQDDNGSNYQIRAAFRKYPSYKESLEDYAKLIKKGLSHNEDFYKPTWKSEAKTYQEATKYLEGRYATDKQYAKKLNAIIEAYDLTQYDEPKKEKTEESVVKTQSKATSFVVPVSWNKKEMSLSDLDVSNFKRTTKKPDYFSTTKVLTIFEVLQRLSAREIPQTSVVKVKADTVPLLSILTIDNLLWIQNKFR